MRYNRSILTNLSKGRQTCYDAKPAMKRASIGLALLFSGFLAGLILTGQIRSASQTLAQPAQPPPRAIAVPAGLSGTLPDLTAVASQAVKGVVNISSVTVTQAPRSP